MQCWRESTTTLQAGVMRMQQLAEIVQRIEGRLRELQPTCQERAPDCERCSGTGWIHPEGESASVARCDCLKRKIAEGRIRAILDDWPEYSDASFDDRPRSLSQIEALKAMRSDPAASWFIHGYYGSGKTRLMIAQYRHLAIVGANCLIRSSKQLMDELRKAEMAMNAPERPFESPVWHTVNQGGGAHLFWDDIEKAPARSDFRAEAVFDLVDTIKRRQVGLTITSNLPLEELIASLGDAAVSRLDRMCRRIEL